MLVPELVGMLLDRADRRAGGTVDVQLPQVESTKHLFLFFLQVFLLLLQACTGPCEEAGVIRVQEITFDVLDRAYRAMRLMGVQPVVDFGSVEPTGLSGNNMDAILCQDNNLSLSEYKFLVMDGSAGFQASVAFQFNTITSPGRCGSTLQL